MTATTKKKTFSTRIHLPPDVRGPMIGLLNQHLADTFGEKKRTQLRPLSTFKQNPAKDSIARKRKAAALDLDFLAETMAGAAKLQKIC